MKQSKKTPPPRVYWIRVEVDSEIPRPDAYVGSLVDTVRDGIHTQKANQMSNETLLALIEGAIASEVLEETDNGAQAARAAGQALHANSSADVPSAKRGATAKPAILGAPKIRFRIN